MQNQVGKCATRGSPSTFGGEGGGGGGRGEGGGGGGGGGQVHVYPWVPKGWGIKDGSHVASKNTFAFTLK